MSSQVSLKVERRDGTGKGVARKLRAAGKLPAVVYGGDAGSIAVSLDAHDTEVLFRSISVENTIVNLDVQGEAAPVPSLIRDIQTHPFRPIILHVDFLRVQTGVEVELDVRVELEGTPTGVKDQGGVLEQTVYMLPIRCVPALIPDHVIYDVSGLEIGDSVHVGELSLPEGVTVLLDQERTVCSVQHPSRAEVEDDEEEDDEEPELVGAEEEDAEAEDEGDGDGPAGA
ncbi:MAG: 50S ribosomal protein L25 [Gemmatimonadota bacterium]